MKRTELLAPAGDADALRAAVENGADAVYLGGRLFNARQSAGNFDREQLKEALDYAHLRGVNLYLTMNTLIADSEIRPALQLAEEAWMTGIDGIIVQDMGIAGLLRKNLPELPLHASTQMTVHDLNGVRFLEEQGFKRVVLARELSGEEIRKIAQNTSLEVEIFIHGALCICYSGQCLMSSIIGGRSGNRGKCAQPCRLPYELVAGNRDTAGCGTTGRSRKGENPRYLLSPKDMCLLENLEEIVNTGVCSLKIEGRMKSPEYVAAVVGTYRKYLDKVLEAVRVTGAGGAAEPGEEEREFTSDRSGISLGRENRLSGERKKDLRELMQVFNRGGFSEGYYRGKSGRDMMSFEKPKNWGIYLGRTVAYNPASGLVRIRLEEDLSIGDGIEIWNGENDSPGTVVSLIRSMGGNITAASSGDTVEVGYVKGRIPGNCMVYKTSDKALNTRLTANWSGKPRRQRNITGRVIVAAGKPMWFQAEDAAGNRAEARGITIPEKAVNRPLTRERLEEQLGKTGGTPFSLQKLEVELEEGLSLPVGEINDVRRRCLEQLEQEILDSYTRGRDPGKNVGPADSEEYRRDPAYGPGREYGRTNRAVGRVPAEQSSNKPVISLFYYKWDKNLAFETLEADRIYLPYDSLIKQGGEDKIKACMEAGIEVFIQLPAIVRGNSGKILPEVLQKAKTLGVGGLLAGSPGELLLLREHDGLRVMGDISFNIFNSYSAAEALQNGLDGIVLSAELTFEQIVSLRKPAGLEVEVPVYGRLPLMTSEYCPVGAVEGGAGKGKKCSGCCSRGGYALKDRMGIEFPVSCDPLDCRARILNSNVLFVPDVLRNLVRAGVGSLRLYIWDETEDRVKNLVRMHRELAAGASPATGGFTGLVEEIKAEGFTKGHFFRGV